MPDAKPAWDAISQISVGEIIAWATAIVSIIVALCTGISKTYKVFTKYKDKQDRDNAIDAKLDAYDQRFAEVFDRMERMEERSISQYNSLKEALDEQRSTKIKELRHSITETGERALSKGKMTIREWTSLHEMYDDYVVKYHQNSFVESLIAKVDRDVEVIGKLDEHGNDIE